MTRRPGAIAVGATWAALLACATSSGTSPRGASGASPEGTPAPGTADVEASFAQAEGLYHDGRNPEALAMLTSIAERPGLAAPERVRALTDRGVIEAEVGQLDTAEESLGGAIAASAGGAARPYVAKARFYLGEIARTRFEAAPLDPSRGDADELARALEAKASLLLVAQDRYLATMSVGDAPWGVAAGTRIGELYEELRRDMIHAPLPPQLAGDAVEAYRAALEEHVRVLVTKAIEVYEATLRVARERDVDTAFVPQLEEGLRRMHRVLGEPAE